MKVCKKAPALRSASLTPTVWYFQHVSHTPAVHLWAYSDCVLGIRTTSRRPPCPPQRHIAEYVMRKVAAGTELLSENNQLAPEELDASLHSSIPECVHNMRTFLS